MTGHLGDEVAAFVDGQLDFARRERALEHLARCADCRAAVEQQRWVKTRVQTLPSAEPSAHLLTTLTRVSAASPRPAPPGPSAPWALPPGPLRRGGLLLAGAGTLAAGFLGVAYAVGGAQAQQPAVSPPVGRFSAEFAGSERPVPFGDPALEVFPVIGDGPAGGGR